MSYLSARERTPGSKLLFAVLIAAFLAIPLFAIYLLVYDRETQSETARASIVQGWGGAQRIAGPELVIPYLAQTSTTETENGQQVTHSGTTWRELTIAPDVADLTSTVLPKRRTRSIYDAVVYQAETSGRARFSMPGDLARLGITPGSLAFDRAELRFGLSDPRGLFGSPPSVSIGGQALALEPGKGGSLTSGSGFHTLLDAGALQSHPLTVDFHYAFRGNGWLSLMPEGGDTRWTVSSPWPAPSFQGGFLPTEHHKVANGFSATWRVGNLALGGALASADTPSNESSGYTPTGDATQPASNAEARVDLVTPVDLYSQVDRSVKYGFLFIGFTFLALLMFDVIGGVRVATVEYLLVGAGLVLFFVMLLAFAEVIGFAFAYVVAAAAIIGLLTAYSAAVLASWRRAGGVAGLLAGLYAVLYVLLSLEDFSLLIGSVLLFAALAAVMYLTRRVDWSGLREVEA